MTFTEAEVEYLQSQPLGRLATVDPSGAPQNNPVGYVLDSANGTIDIGGFRMGATRKFHNVERGQVRVAFVVDDLISTDPWQVRCLEIRGRAEALRDASTRPGFSPEILRIHPERIFTFGINPGEDRMVSRSVQDRASAP